MKFINSKKLGCFVLSTLITASTLMSNLVGIIPDAVNDVRADETHNHNHSGWTNWGDDADEQTSMPDSEGNYYLTSDINLSYQWDVSQGTINLCLNGHKIVQTKDFQNTIYITNGATLNLYDESDNGGTITHSKDEDNKPINGSGVWVDDGTFNMHGGSVSGNAGDNYGYGGGVYIDNGTVEISGGFISDNTARWGGGVFVSSGTLEVSGGTISGNTALDGGGIYITDGTTLTMTGGTVTKNIALGKPGTGGGIYSSGTFNMSGGTVTGNTTVTYGNNVYVAGPFNPSGTAIIDGGLYSRVYTCVCFYANDGTDTMTSQIIEKGKDVLLDQNGFAYEGYSFTGWNTEKDGTGTAYLDSASVNIDILFYDDLILYAQWAKGHEKHDIQNTETDDSHHEGWTPWNDSDSLPTVQGSYYLVTDVELSSKWIVPQGTTNLCLNGHKIVQTKDGDETIYIGKGATLNLYDKSDNSGTITHLKDGNDKPINGSGIYGEDGTFNMYGGSVSGNTTDNRGGGVWFLRGTVKISGGNVSGNTSRFNGGGICVDDGTTEISGGFIFGNKSESSNISGGGVAIFFGTLEMKDGTIYKNTAANGGGVSIYGGIVEISGGTISENTATKNGGGVEIDYGTTLKMTGGTINNNKSSNKGGGVYSVGIYNMFGGTVTGNTADTAGKNVYFDAVYNGTFTPNDTATIDGGLYSDDYTCVCFYANDGTETMTSQIIEKGKNVKLDQNGFAYEGYSFNRWNTKADGTGTAYPDSASVNIDKSFYDDLILYAQWANGHKDHKVQDTLTDHSHHEGWIAWNDPDSLPTAQGSYYLVTDVNLSSRWTVPQGTTNLCLNGHNIVQKTDGIDSIYIPSNAILNLYDESDNGGTITHLKNDNSKPIKGRGVYVDKGTFNMYGGTISENTANYYGGGVYISSGTVEIFGGTISGNSADSISGGGVFISSGTLIISGGTITKNSSVNGGGIFVNDGIVKISGGIISRNTADYGGGINIKSGTVEISGGTISGNEAKEFGGGVRVFGGTVEIKDGTIIENTAANGGGVYISLNETLTMTGGIITKNKVLDEENNGAGYGGGVYCAGTYNMSGGTVTVNTAATDGNNVYIHKKGTFNPSGNATIDGGLVSELYTTVCFNANGGEGKMRSRIIKKGEDTVLPANIFTLKDSIFIGWNTEIDGSGDSYADEATVNVTANEGLTLYAQYAPDKYTITVTDDGNGTGMASASTGIIGDEITLTATPAAGYKFKEWKVVSGGVTVADNKFTVGMADVTVKAVFEAVDYTVTVTTDGNGTASATKTLGNIGDEVTLSATPAAGYTFKAWEVVSGSVTVSYNKFTIGTADVTVKAIFEAIDYTVIVMTDGHGTVSATKTTGNIGDVVTLSATPAAGYKFKEWEVVSGGVTVADNKFAIGTTDVTVKAVFEAIDYTVIVMTDGHGTVSATKTSGNIGDEVTLSATPAKGYKFKEWKVVSGGVTVAENKFKIGSADVKVQAIFEPVYYAVKVMSEGNGTVTSSASSAIIGTEVTLTATPDDEDKFAGWEVVSGGITLADETKATTTFTMGTSAVEVKAVFVPKTYTVMVIGGTADNATASKGDTVKITANDPSKGKEFDKWTSDSDKVIFADEKASSTSFNMLSGTVKVTANFKDIVYKVTVTDDGNGTGKASASTGIMGDEITLTATPAAGYKFKEWKVVSGGVTVADNKFTIGTADVTVKAIFEAIDYTVIVMTDGHGTVSATKTTGNIGDVVTLSATPAAGYKFKEWKVVSGGVTVADNKFTVGTADVTVKAIFVAIDYKVTVTTDGNGTASATKTMGNIGDEVTLIATPNEGYKFKEWEVVSGGVTVTDNKFTIGTANVTVEAIFEAIDYKVTITTDGNGTASATLATGNIGDEITLTATPAAGYKFKEWEVVSGGVTVADNKFEIGTANVTVKAVFEAINYTVTVTTDGNGTASATKTTGNIGDVVTLSASPAAGYKFKEWKVVSGGVTVADNKLTIGTANVTVKAVFEAIDYTVTVTTDGNGTASATKTMGNIGDEVTLTATANAGYKFKEWKVVSGGVTVVDNKFAVGTADVTVKAIFEAIDYTVTVTTDGNGTASATKTTGNIGDEVTLTATPNEGYKFKEWKVVSGGVTVADNKFTVGTADVTVKAVFEAIEYTVKFVKEDGTEYSSSRYPYGTKAEDIVLPDAPSKEASKEFTYTFAGWGDIEDVTGDATYKASYSETTNKYTVTFISDSKVIFTKDYPYGTEAADIEVPDDPAIDPTVQYTYTFKGWSPEITKVTGNATYTAQFSSTVNEYTVTFAKEDGTEYSSSRYPYGTKAEDIVLPDAPGKEASKEFTYTFAGWGEIKDVTGDATYKASYTETTNKYTVTFRNYNDEVISSAEYDYGTEASAIKVPTDFTREGNAKFTYTFKGWDEDIADVTDDATYTATYTETVNEYTVTFISDGKVVFTKDYPYGTEADDIEVPEDPTIDPTAQYTYTFEGWTPEIAKVTGDATYTARFSSKVNEYTVSFADEDGTELQSVKVEYGKNPSYSGETPVKESTEKSTFVFAGWSDGKMTYRISDTLPKVTGDAVYKAVYADTEKEYTVTFVNEDGTVLQTVKVPYGTVPAYTGKTPVKAETDKSTFVFSGWTPEIAEVTGDAAYKAVFTEVAKPEPTPGSYYLKGIRDDEEGNKIVELERTGDEAHTIDYYGKTESDGKVLKEGEQIEVTAGSVIIKLKKEYLDTLSEGTHTLKVYFKDGVTVTLNYNVKHASSIPSTGEQTDRTVFVGIGMMVAAGLVLGAVVLRKKRKEEA